MPLAIQHLYFALEEPIILVAAIASAVTRYKINFNHRFLNAPSVQEMLIYHASTENPVDDPNATYTHHPYYDVFFNDLRSLGDYPRMCKLMAFSNGLVTGTNQAKPYDATQLRVANDRLLDFDGAMYARILCFNIKILQAVLNIKTNPEPSATNPSGQGLLDNIQVGTPMIYIHLFWFGIDVGISYNNIANYQKWAAHITSPDVHAGGNENYYPDPTGGSANSSSYHLSGYSLLDLFNYDYDISSNGTLHFNSSVGIPYIVGLNVNANMYTDGIGFGFVPLQSALDYRLGYTDLSHNIQNDPINVQNARSPFHVIQAIPATHPSGLPPYSPIPNQNQTHLYVRNEQLELPGPAPRLKVPFSSCPHMLSYHINREIGDEDLWLDQGYPHWYSTYESEFDTHVNDMNPLYHYDGSATTIYQPLDAVYADRPQYRIDGSAAAPVDFYYGGGFSYLPPYTDPYNATARPLEICCQDYGKRNIGQPEAPTLPTADRMEIYPNPSAGQALLRYSLSSPAAASIRVTDLLGRLIWQRDMPAGNPGADSYVPIDMGRQPAGCYIVTITSPDYTLSQKLIIQ